MARGFVGVGVPAKTCSIFVGKKFAATTTSFVGVVVEEEGSEAVAEAVDGPGDEVFSRDSAVIAFVAATTRFSRYTEWLLHRRRFD
jgi:hypothetical protein